MALFLLNHLKAYLPLSESLSKTILMIEDHLEQPAYVMKVCMDKDMMGGDCQSLWVILGKIVPYYDLYFGKR